MLEKVGWVVVTVYLILAALIFIGGFVFTALKQIQARNDPANPLSPRELFAAIIVNFVCFIVIGLVWPVFAIYIMLPSERK